MAQFLLSIENYILNILLNMKIVIQKFSQPLLGFCISVAFLCDYIFFIF